MSSELISGASIFPLLLLILSAVMTTIIAYGIREFALMNHIVAKRENGHRVPAPLLGGISIYPIFAICALGLSLTQVAGAIDTETSKFILKLIFSSALVAGLGIANDLFPVSIPLKLSVQAVAAMIMVSEPAIRSSLSHTGLPSPITFLIIVSWMILMSSVFQFLDDLDGYPTALGAVIATALFAILAVFSNTTHPIALLMITLAGASMGFLLHNKHPARILLGHSGSHWIGFVLSVVSLYVTAQRQTWLIGTCLFGIPLVDLLLVTISRIGDRGHVHHRLLRLGMSPSKALALLMTANLCAGTIALVIARAQPGHRMLPAAAALTLFVVFFGGVFVQEKRLLRRAVWLGYAFQKKNELPDLPLAEGIRFIFTRMENRFKNVVPFSLMLIDFEKYPDTDKNIREAFYREIRSILRVNDWTMHISEKVILLYLHDMAPSEEACRSLISRICATFSELQQDYGIHSEALVLPHGITILHYPKHQARIRHIMRLIAPPANTPSDRIKKAS